MPLINLISLYLMFISVAVVFYAAQVRTLNGSQYTLTALLLCCAVSLYILGYAMELNASTPIQIRFWNRIEYIGIPFVSALWLTTSLIYTGRFSRHKKLLLAVIYIIPAVTLILRLTNDCHHLYFASVGYQEISGQLYFVKQIGPWMFVQMLHSSIMILAAMGLFIYDYLKNDEKQPGKILLVIAASFFALAGLFLTRLKPFGVQIDYMAMCLPITCAMVILSITRYDLLETKSIARSKVFEASGDAILLMNRHGRVIDRNGSAKRLFEQLDIRLDNGYFPSLSESNADLLEGLKKTEPSVVKVQMNDGEHYFGIGTENIDDRNMLRGWIKTVRDVTEIYKLNEELKKQAMTDELSLLINRRAFLKFGKEWVAESEQSGSILYLLMMDLDRFKTVNDNYGHPAGDIVITEFARLLKSHFDSNSLISRIGGEEFVVLLSGFMDGELLESVRAFHENAEKHTYRCSGNRFHVTVSIGMTKKQPGQTLDSMMHTADKALYRSKDSGTNCITVL